MQVDWSCPYDVLATCIEPAYGQIYVHIIRHRVEDYREESETQIRFRVSGLGFWVCFIQHPHYAVCPSIQIVNHSNPRHPNPKLETLNPKPYTRIACKPSHFSFNICAF